MSLLLLTKTRDRLPNLAVPLLVVAVVACQLAVAPAAAQTAPASEEREILDEIIVRSTRAERTLEELPRSAIVLSSEDLAKFNQQTTSVQEILGKAVPGFAPPVTEGSAASLTLRGRNPLFLIDGVPIASNTNFSRFLDKFDPLTIGSVEVVYGPTSLYGAGATGGVVQFFTQDPAEEGLEFSVGTQFRGFATGGDSFSSDGFSPKLNASISGRLSDRVSVLGYVSYEDINGVFSADDELVTGRSAFANDTTFFGKLRFDIDANQSLTAIVNSTELESASRQFELGGTLNSDGATVAEEASVVFSYANPPTNEFIYSTLNNKHLDLLGGTFDAMLYFSDSEFLNPGSDIRGIIAAGVFPAEWPGLWQTGRINEELGLRGQYVRDVSEDFSVSVGFDFNTVDSDSLLPISTETDFDTTRFFDAARQDEQTPPFTLDAVGLFVEASYNVNDRLAFKGGLRWDRFEYEVVGPYDVVFFFPPISLPGVRPGGDGSASDISFNMGATYDVTDSTTLFANVSQGFAIPSLGFVGNFVDPGVPISGSELVDPVITDSVEFGVRGSIGDVVYTAAVYYTESDFQTTVSIASDTGLNNRTRAPVRIGGTELVVEWDINERLGLDGSLTYVYGEVDPADNDNFIAVTTQDIPPLKLSLNPRYQISDNWSLIGQLLYVADRDEAFEAGTDPRPSESYILLDIGTTLALDYDRFGRGTLNFQVTNAANENYIPAGEITFIPGRVRPGPGRALTVSYQHSF
ncbi:MAG: TonB-dependent receptor [Pseudomonadota bacterium]